MVLHSDSGGYFSCLSNPVRGLLDPSEGLACSGSIIVFRNVNADFSKFFRLWLFDWFQ